MFELTAVNIEAWLGTLSSRQLNDLSDTVDKYENMGLNDTIVKAYSVYIQEMRNLKDTGTNNNLTTTHQKSLLVALHTPTKSHFCWLLANMTPPTKVTFGGIAHPTKSHFWWHCTPHKKSLLVALHTPPKVTFGS